MLDDYFKKTIWHIIDEVCIFEGRKSIFPDRQYDFRMIPQKFENFQESFLIEEEIILANERENLNGKTGWCWICRKGSDFYCKDFRLPICSISCKRSLAEINGNKFSFFFI
jgi:hypothetical protein